MKHKFKITYSLLLLLLGSSLLQQCKYNEQNSDATTKSETTDSKESETTKAAIDTSIKSETKVIAEISNTIKDTSRITKIKVVPKVTKIIKTKEVRAPLTLMITNLASPTAPVIVGLYEPKNDFPNPKDQMKEYKFKPVGKQLTARIPNLQFGTYAIALYQDENSDGKIDKNLIGIPTERYAFSNNYKPTIKAPSFKDCKFEYTAKSNTINIIMLK